MAREPRLLGLKYNGSYMCRCDQHNGTYEPQYKIESNQHVADELFAKEDQKQARRRRYGGEQDVPLFVDQEVPDYGIHR